MRRDLHEAFVAQYVLQREAYKTDPRNLSPTERAEWVRWNMLALMDELHEAMGEVGWKPWATSRHLNREAYKGELVDAFHFFINLCLVADISADELIAGYFTKRERNSTRQRNGYTGLDKCPGCKRAWDDIEASKKTYTAYRSAEGVTYCSNKCAEDSAALSQ